MEWIKIESESDLPQDKGSSFCWVMISGKVSIAIYQSKHFELKAEYRLYPWHLITHYQPIAKPEPPEKPSYCPECMEATPQEELDMFGGFCEECI